MRQQITGLLVGVSLSTGAAAHDPTSVPLEKQLEIVRQIAPSLVRVEYTLKFDKAEAPKVRGVRERCPNCGRYHGEADGEELVKDERPVEIGGFLIDTTRVVLADPLIHPRFVKAIHVRFEDRRIEARPAAVAHDQRAVFLELIEPLEQTRPLDFDATRPPPYLSVVHTRASGIWTIHVQSLPLHVTCTETGRPYVSAPSTSLIVDNGGVPVGVCLNERLDLTAGWKGSPADWMTSRIDSLTARIAELDRRAAANLPRVHLSFRSPKKTVGEFYMGGYGDDDPNELERHVTGVIVDPRHMLVLANLKPEVTARLERIVAYPAGGGAVPARFVGSLADYGCFLAEFESPAPAITGDLAVSGLDLRLVDQTLLPAIQVRLHGEQRITYPTYERLVSLYVGWQGRLYPEVVGEDSDLFIFDPDTALLAFPLVRRESPGREEEWDTGWPVLTPARYVTQLLGEPSEHLDLSNVPLTEDEEDRLAWLGVELQALNRDLARVNGVAHLTEDGETGALVSFVYSDSPAEEGGIEVGDILLRLHVSGRPIPTPVDLRQSEFMMPPFSWDQLDQVPVEFLEQIPPPWPPARNPLRETLTGLGFGKRYIVELFRRGEVLKKPFEVQQSPIHFDAAKQLKSEALGLTVRDLTFEVRRYFQKDLQDPGVIVSRVEPGGKAAVAGIKPFEIISQVNDASVADVAMFSALVQDQTELRFSVDRKGRGRLVRVSLPDREKH